MSEHGTAPPQSRSVVSAHRTAYRERLKPKPREQLQEMLETERQNSARAGPDGDYHDVEAGEKVADIKWSLGQKEAPGEPYVNLMPRYVQGS